MARGKNVFAKLSLPVTNPTAISAAGVNDIVLHALICRVALQNEEVVEFGAVYDKATDTIELDVPTEAMPIFEQLTGMQRGDKLRTFINWLIGSESLETGTSLEQDPTFVSAGSLTSWTGATVGNLEDNTLVWFLPTSDLSTLGYNVKVNPEFAGGDIRVSLIWVYDSGSNTSFDIMATANVTELTTNSTFELSNTENISTFNLVQGDIRETVILEGSGVAADDLISLVLRRNFSGTTEPSVDLIGVVGIKVELIES
jgi:hypothetical protein